MERTVSVEEKIRRAEEIYNKRRNPQARIETETINTAENSFIKRKMKKLFMQMSICIIIYVILYSTDFGGTIFKQDTANYIKTFLAEDIDFQGVYKNVDEYIQIIIPKENSDGQNNVNSNEETPGIETNDIEVNSIETDTNNGVNEINNIDGNSNIITNEGEAEVQNEITNIVEEVGQNQEKTTNDEDIVNYENNIGGAVEVEEVSDESPEEQKTQMEIDAEYILSKVNFIKPVENYQISSRYGLRNPTTSTVPKNHTGIDLAADKGTKIVSATDGTVVLASSVGDYGNHLKIQIDDITIIYAHCNKLYVGEGEQIYQGQEIGEVGSTGNSTGPHLHFEVRVEDRVIDPEYIMDFT